MCGLGDLARLNLFQGVQALARSMQCVHQMHGAELEQLHGVRLISWGQRKSFGVASLFLAWEKLALAQRKLVELSISARDFIGALPNLPRERQYASPSIKSLVLG